MPRPKKRAAQSSKAGQDGVEELQAASEWNDYYNLFSCLKDCHHSSSGQQLAYRVLSAIKVSIGCMLDMGKARAISINDIDERVANDLFLTSDEVTKIRKEWEDSLATANDTTVASNTANDTGGGTWVNDSSNTAADGTTVTLTKKRAPEVLQTQPATELPPRKRQCKGWTGNNYRKLIQVSIAEQMRGRADRYSETVLPTCMPLSSLFEGIAGHSELCVRCENIADNNTDSDSADPMLRFSIRAKTCNLVVEASDYRTRFCGECGLSSKAV